MTGIDVWNPGVHELAEGPVWDDRRASLWWVDILRGRVFVQAWDDRTPRVYTVRGETVGSIALADDGRVLLATTTGLAWLDPASGDIDPVAELPGERGRRNRTNDGKAGPDGAFYIGSMPLDGAPAQGTLHRWRPGGAPERLLDGIGASNGLDWSADACTFFFTDTAARTITAYRADDLSPIGLVFDLGVHPGLPDGFTVDAEGCLWVCFWDGAALRRFSPRGELLREIALPVDRPTSCAFAGPRLDRLVVTTAAYGLDARARAARPRAGSLLLLDVGVTGRLPYRIAVA